MALTDDLVAWVMDDRNFRRIVSTLVIIMGTLIVYMVVRVVLKDSDKPPTKPLVDPLAGLDAIGSDPDFDEKGDEGMPNLLDTRNDPDILYGSTDKYDWTQTESEVEVFVKLDKFSNFASLRAKDIRANITSTGLSVAVNGETLLKGDFPAKVLADDCTWQLEEPRNSDKRIWITLYKAVPTMRNQHWKSVLKGDPEIDVGRLGPPVHGVDTSDKNAMKKAAQQVTSL